MLPGPPCVWFLLTPGLLFYSQVVLKGDAKKLQLYGVSVLGQHMGIPVGKAKGTLPGFLPELFRNLFSPSLLISLGKRKKRKKGKEG